MKIYPGGHIISTTEQITSNHIPISYFKKSDKGIIPSIIIEDEFCRSNTKDNVYPYQKFENEVMFFDVDDNKIDNSSDYLVNRNDLYYYEPKDSVEFIPTKVTMSILLNRSDVYKSDVKYSINVGCYSEDIAESIIGLFNSKSVLKPSNININNNAIVPFDLINSNGSNQDFIFINNEDVTSDVLENFLNSNTNVWILNNEIDGLFCMQNENSNSKYTLSYSTVFSSKEHTINSYDNIVFSKQSTIEKLNEYEAINVFTSYMPIVIYKKPDSGFVIVSHTNIFKNVEESYKLIFEIIMSVYLNSYSSLFY